jgi:hypothetical protein
MGILPMSRRAILALQKVVVSRAGRPWDTRARCPCYFAEVQLGSYAEDHNR